MKADDYNKKLEYIKNERRRHKGEWITAEDANEYMQKAKSLSMKNPADVGERRELRIELQKRFGLTEIEAINILNGNGIADYVNKYYRIKNEIVDSSNENSEFQIWLKNEFMRQDYEMVKDDGWYFADDR